MATKKKSGRMTMTEVLLGKALWYTLGKGKEVLVSRRGKQFWVTCEYPEISFWENYQNLPDGTIRECMTSS
jgi:hypothetical protein